MAFFCFFVFINPDLIKESILSSIVSLIGLNLMFSSFFILLLSALNGMFTLFKTNLLLKTLSNIGPNKNKNHFGMAFLGSGILFPYLGIKSLDISKKSVL